MGKLSDFLVGVPGYFREGEDESFPWGRTDKAVWYALFVVEGGKLKDMDTPLPRQAKRIFVRH